MHDKVLVAQGGGPTAVINQSLVGVVLEARKFQHVERIYGARHGVRGIDQRGLRRPDARDQPQPRDGRPTRHPRPWARPATSPTGNIARRSSRCCRRTASAISSTSAATTPSDTVRIVAEEAQAADYDAALHPHPQDHRQRSGGQRPHARATPRPRASSPRPSWAPTSTTARCPASMSPSSWAAMPAS